MAPVYIGIGSNLGDRAANLERAKREILGIPGVAITGESSVEETEPVDYLDQPMFLNQVVLIETDIDPLTLLGLLEDIETAMGRERNVDKGPRAIDLDILLYGRRIVASERLTIPHHAITRRPFVMRHLLEIDPLLADPVTRKPYREVYAQCRG